jgi:predicted amidophosphoribosyltransferase
LTIRFRRVDDQNRSDHYHLTADDECFYLLEYTSGQNYSFSETNSLISNLKKRPSLAGTAQYRYKSEAIDACGPALGEAINPSWLADATLVPVPPSKARGDAEYDDRVLRICRAIPSAAAIDVREIVLQTRSLQAAHETGAQRPSVEDLLAVYQIDETKTEPAPRQIGVVDDVLTVGTHFRAMKTILRDRFPGVGIVGFFIARRVFPDPFEAVAP